MPADTRQSSSLNTPGRPCPCVYRGALYHSLGPDQGEFFADGALAVNAQGLIEACGSYADVQKQLRDQEASYTQVRLAAEQLLLPGLIDLHVHLPQLPVTGRQADDLLSWLTRHIFTAEIKCADAVYARALSAEFFEKLLENGTTTAAVFLTSHTEATQIAFEEAEKRGNRVIMGLNLMDKNAPPELIRPAADLLSDTEALCQRWHGKANGLLQYAWMPRFALTSSEELLEGIGALRKRYPDVYMHTHLSEQTTELEAVAQQFPWSKHYTQVYDHFGLLAPKSILAHGIYLSDDELDRIDETRCGLAHCPSSNFFLKSGRFPWFKIAARGSRVGLGSDVGAGPDLSMFNVMKDAQYMQTGQTIALHALLHAATLGAAHALHQADRIGNFVPGKEADFVVLDLNTLAPGIDRSADIVTRILEMLVYHGEASMIVQTAVCGKVLYRRDGQTLAESIPAPV